MKVCLHSDEIGDADFAPLHAHGFDDEDIWDIGAITAFFGLSNRIANFSGMLPNPEFYLMGRVPREKKRPAPLIRRCGAASPAAGALLAP
jgi:hypothetical protein